MLSTDREQFEAQLAALCAGFNVPATKERQEAYWTGLSKMSLPQFGRAVESALGEDGPEKFPTTGLMWKLYKQAKSQSQTIKQNVPQTEEHDHLLFFANRMFMRHLHNRQGLGSTGRFIPAHGMVDCKASSELLAARKVVRELVDYFSGPICEGDEDATPAEFVAQLIVALDKVSRIDSKTLRGWGEMSGHADAKKPFERYMGRPLPEKYDRAGQLMLA
jgi:hypothetical protein